MSDIKDTFVEDGIKEFEGLTKTQYDIQEGTETNRVMYLHDLTEDELKAVQTLSARFPIILASSGTSANTHYFEDGVAQNGIQKLVITADAKDTFVSVTIGKYFMKV